MEIDWRCSPDIEVIPEKVSGQPVLKGRRITPDAITVNYESAIARGMTPDQAIAEVNEDYPGAGVERIKRLLDYYHSRQTQPQP